MSGTCITIEKDYVLDVVSDFGDIEDSLVWVIETLGHYEAEDLVEASQNLLKEVAQRKGQLLKSNHAIPIESQQENLAASRQL